jgi:hypothetical protein
MEENEKLTNSYDELKSNVITNLQTSDESEKLSTDMKKKKNKILLDKKFIPNGFKSYDETYGIRHQITYRVVIPIFIAGVILLSLGIFCEEYNWGIDKLISFIIKEIGVVLMVVAVIHSIYELRIHKYLHGDIMKLGYNVEKLQRTVSIVGGAIESGLSAVYSSRDEVNKAIEEEIENMKPGSKLRLLGISLGAFLCPHGALHGVFRKLLAKKDLNIVALILDANSEAALERAKLEEPRFFINKQSKDEILEAYGKTRCHNELKTATDFAQDVSDHCWFRDKNMDVIKDAPNEPPILGNFQYKVYSVSPLCYLVIFENCMFLENYHNAGRGGESPVLKIGKHSGERMEMTSLFRIYENHFNVMENHSYGKK